MRSTSLNVPYSDFQKKNITQTDLLNLISNIPRPIVFTNGVFDILHRGHVYYLEKARAFGKTMIVGVNSDLSVKMLGKGKNRPFNSQEDRISVIAALESTDFVILFEEKTPKKLISLIQPDIYIKGGDYDLSSLEEKKQIEVWGGKVLIIPFIENYSTTRLIKKIGSLK